LLSNFTVKSTCAKPWCHFESREKTIDRSAAAKHDCMIRVVEVIGQYTMKKMNEEKRVLVDV